MQIQKRNIKDDENNASDKTTRLASKKNITILYTTASMI